MICIKKNAHYTGFYGIRSRIGCRLWCRDLHCLGFYCEKWLKTAWHSCVENGDNNFLFKLWLRNNGFNSSVNRAIFSCGPPSYPLCNDFIVLIFNKKNETWTLYTHISVPILVFVDQELKIELLNIELPVVQTILWVYILFFSLRRKAFITMEDLNFTMEGLHSKTDHGDHCIIQYSTCMSHRKKIFGNQYQNIQIFLVLYIHYVCLLG